MFTRRRAEGGCGHGSSVQLRLQVRMDMVFNYLPDVFSYQSMRHYNYDNSWLQDGTNRDSRVKYGTPAPKTRKTPRDPCSKDSSSAKDSCPICQERQRRPLATYIRSKSRQDKREDNSIQEENEAEELPEQPVAEQETKAPAK